MTTGLDDLTPSQQVAVDHLNGPLLILAGPGSGKTRVITRRIARMIERGVAPQEILAITFTNKASSEMQQRVAGLLPRQRVWVSTFHKFCARMLRRRAEAVGLQSNFTIFDTTDQRQLIRQILRELNIDAVAFPPARIAARISRAKNDLMTASDFVRRFSESIGSHYEAVVARVFPRYQQGLLSSNAVDFDDLLTHVVRLLTENPELRRALDERFRYCLVDEYQDTNLAQYRIVRALSHDHPNLCVTGDPDQSIYGWRGAQIDNILRFEADYPTATVVRLEQNFRSTKKILRAADSLIVHNHYRKEKSLVTENPQGAPVELLTFADATQEADAIAQRIRRHIDSGTRQASDFAIIYRVNALSRTVEQSLSWHGVGFQVAAGLAFYERAEVKDMLAYLRLIENPNDEIAFRRVVNTPRRGIGRTTLRKLTDWAETNGLSLFDAAARAAKHPELSKRAVTLLTSFAQKMTGIAQAAANSVAELLERVIVETGYNEGLRGSESERNQARLENVQELVTTAGQYDDFAGDEATLEGFLESASLVSDVDGLDESVGRVTLMTLHAAKGLEFPVVYILAVEDGLIPHERSIKSDDWRDLEEERRLLFVGMTRAMQRLYLTQTVKRTFRGRTLNTIRSEFLSEIGLLENGLRQDQGETDVSPIEPILPQVSIGSDASGFGVSTSGGTLKPRPLLTTGADLLHGTSNSSEIPKGFAVGMAVRHPRYGQGTVVEIGGFSKRRTVTVEFGERDRRETFVAAQCPLQPVGVS